MVTIVGAGPAGCSAALAALNEGSAVTIYEKSRFPRHKVCGEFLSPESGRLLHDLGLLAAIEAANAVRLTRVILHIGRSCKRFPLPEPAYSLSRSTLDHLLLTEAIKRGAILKSESAKAGTIIAHGRQTPTRKGSRLFGFKAHFAGGPVEDTVEMFFFKGCYVGVSSVEGGAVNVCGLGPEELLRSVDFQPDALFPDALKDRLRHLHRSFDWLITGPLVFRDSFHDQPGAYLAGDAMGFVDPFTGSGILSAILTGRMAGQAAARSIPISEYTTQCRRTLSRQYSVASTLRGFLGAGLAEALAGLVPGPWLYRMTRPSL
jgi:flavin-dependent dehydrogenase